MKTNLTKLLTAERKVWRSLNWKPNLIMLSASSLEVDRESLIKELPRRKGLTIVVFD